ncbi:MAG: SUMF1/EgtB/PvdO family nonheme iron enzyme [Roseivirga sp.]|jgi:formylglycine-generating enzyme required for sulfatase activity|uniref:formylglycine-generating enzyme family protein n=1 Tax=Roseivirga sp. TaxID=1964215 RepID=UPI001B013371|nr:SUMF1/EgtB/PvdO family nonheme iron enzyme [Roseivirga sp.]MBO6494191.1 SUMF1/EgtB/PvdO family nonheme iron enzyme [Roseivirga sp.]MBO6661352.1 SUMF1/EgtB/PvdO family nonheme iron enzyme [Roseivirga sp.]MBO6908664.1 SUMF1/EgtB/PvdO family nonheme iron enzyme [Roseivirga sp.]
MNKANTLLLAILLFSTPSFAQKKAPKIPDLLSEKHWAYIPSQAGENGFYMAKFETTVKDYRAFYMGTGEESADHSPSMEIWNFKEGWDQSKIEYYYKHPGFDNYPIVGVDLSDAKAFAEWLTVEYNNQPKREFEEVIFRLPTEQEWEWAARAGNDIAPFPWGGPYIRNSKGDILANILRVSDTNIISQVQDDGSIKFSLAQEQMKSVRPTSYTTPVNQFIPNRYGLYNMSGNVSEMTTSLYVEGLNSTVAKGGSYLQTPYWAMISSRQEFLRPTAYTGFRLVMEVVEK